jgi:hypothetical protein
MRMIHNNWLRYVIIAVCSVAVATGCIIRREPLIRSYNDLTPRGYCPGDTLTASYDFLQELRCPTGLEATCSDFSPTVAISSDSMVFPAQSIRGYTGNISFIAPDADRVSVMFNPSADEVTIPTEEIRDGTRVFVARPSLDRTSVASRQAPLDQTLVHDGMCAGSAAVNTPQTLPGLPQFSPNLRLNDLCNTNSVPVIATLSGGADGMTYTQMLSPGQCLSSMPGVPNSTQNARLIEVRPAVTDPSTRCTATGPNMPPPTLRMRARMACGV